MITTTFYESITCKLEQNVAAYPPTAIVTQAQPQRRGLQCPQQTRLPTVQRISSGPNPIIHTWAQSKHLLPQYKSICPSNAIWNSLPSTYFMSWVLLPKRINTSCLFACHLAAECSGFFLFPAGAIILHEMLAK